MVLPEQSGGRVRRRQLPCWAHLSGWALLFCPWFSLSGAVLSHSSRAVPARSGESRWPSAVSAPLGLRLAASFLVGPTFRGGPFFLFAHRCRWASVARPSRPVAAGCSVQFCGACPPLFSEHHSPTRTSSPSIRPPQTDRSCDATNTPPAQSKRESRLATSGDAPGLSGPLGLTYVAIQAANSISNSRRIRSTVVS